MSSLQTWARLPTLLANRDLETYRQLLEDFEFHHTEITMGTTFGMAARAGPEYLQPLLVCLDRCSPRPLAIVVSSVMIFTPELYLQMLPYLENGKLQPMLYLRNCPEDAVTATLAALEGLLGSPMTTAMRVEKLLIEHWGQFCSAPVVQQLLDFVESLVPDSQLFQPIRFASTLRNRAEFELLLAVYPEVSLESCVANIEDASLKTRLADHGRQLHVRWRPLMQRLCSDIVAQGHPKMQTSIELDRLSRQARYSMLCWYAVCWIEEGMLHLNAQRLQLKYATLDVTVAWFQRALASSIGPWVLLMLGFADPVPELDHRWDERFERCVRYNAAYGTAAMIEHLLAYAKGDLYGILYCLVRCAISYGQTEMIKLGLSLKSDWSPECMAYFRENAESMGRLELLPLLVG